MDLARALAVVFMVYGHSVDALLAPQYRVGTWFDVWQFQRGLTSCLFLSLSGFAFSIATGRRWTQHVAFSAALARRTRRFLWFVILGYALHFPVQHLAQLATAAPELLRSFLAVDVLQLIGVTFVLVQILVIATRTRRAFMLVALALAASIVITTPVMWGVDWMRRLPLAIAAYLGPSTGSQFPLFPWAAYVLFGAGLGQLYARWGAGHLGTYANFVLLVPGLVLAGAGLTVGVVAPELFGTNEFNWIPPQVMVRAGACLLILAVMAHGSGRLHRLPRVFGAVAQETLLIYFVHLCIVYGSIWNRGLAQIYGPTLTPAQTVLTVVLLLAAMVGLAAFWNWQKHAHQRVARWTSLAVGAALMYALV
jgi:acyltransferase